MGLPGTGKTYNAARAIDRARRLVVWDPMHCFNGIPGPRSNFTPGCVIIRGIPALVDFMRVNRRGNFRVIYQPGYNLEKEFDAVSKIVLEVRNCVFFVDEIWQVCRPAWMPPALNLMSRAWAHRGVCLIYTAQRPQVVAADLRENTTQWRLFTLKGKLALDALRGHVSDECIARVPSLPPRVYLQAGADEFKEIRPGRWALR